MTMNDSNNDTPFLSSPSATSQSASPSSASNDPDPLMRPCSELEQSSPNVFDDTQIRTPLGFAIGGVPNPMGDLEVPRKVANDYLKFPYQDDLPVAEEVPGYTILPNSNGNHINHANSVSSHPPPSTSTITDPGITHSFSSRPSPPNRQPSYSKRHASFDTPREVPFPCTVNALDEYPFPKRIESPLIHSSDLSTDPQIQEDPFSDSNKVPSAERPFFRSSNSEGEASATIDLSSTSFFSQAPEIPSPPSSSTASIHHSPLESVPSFKTSEKTRADGDLTGFDFAPSPPELSISTSTISASARPTFVARPSSPTLVSLSQPSTSTANFLTTSLPPSSTPTSPPAPSSSADFISPLPSPPPLQRKGSSSASLPLPTQQPVGSLPPLSPGSSLESRLNLRSGEIETGVAQSNGIKKENAVDNTVKSPGTEKGKENNRDLSSVESAVSDLDKGLASQAQIKEKRLEYIKDNTAIVPGLNTVAPVSATQTESPHLSPLSKSELPFTTSNHTTPSIVSLESELGTINRNQDHTQGSKQEGEMLLYTPPTYTDPASPYLPPPPSIRSERMEEAIKPPSLSPKPNKAWFEARERGIAAFGEMGNVKTMSGPRAPSSQLPTQMTSLPTSNSNSNRASAPPASTRKDVPRWTGSLPSSTLRQGSRTRLGPRPTFSLPTALRMPLAHPQAVSPLLSTGSISGLGMASSAYSYQPPVRIPTPPPPSPPTIYDPTSWERVDSNDSNGRRSTTVNRSSTGIGSGIASNSTSTTATTALASPTATGASNVPPTSPSASAAEGGMSKGADMTRSRSTHERFLAKAGLPPPPESGTGTYIAVETTEKAYVLVCRLEGVERDGITLSTRKKRTLHLAADSYDSSLGGHFERRITFGYDADLSGVRAEFDGVLLRVIVPRFVRGASGAAGAK